MASTPPTDRPLVTPVRAAITTAAVAVASGLFLAFGVAHSEVPASSSAVVACAEQPPIADEIHAGPPVTRQ